ncbi:unnamed protein product [Brassica napus]|uniref:S-protein homolog n=1 Tax=Brassica napus TaxID=3708 RepID=A0A817AGN8_BRANA|nr:unnamed protein product [Brassica napus]
MVFLTNRHLIFVLITYLIILRTSLSLEHSVNGDVPFLPKHVMITNKLVTREGMVLHCRNKGKDLGFKAILADESFDFRFHLNIRRTAVYTCTFSWHGNVKRFDIFRADRDDNPRSTCGICRECIWHISESGPCRMKRDGGSSYCFPWAS